MPDSPPPLDPVQLGAYFDLIEVTSLLRHAVEQQLREAGDLSYVQFQLLARLGDSPTGSHRMTDLADGVVYSRSGLTYQAGLLEKAGLVTRAPAPRTSARPWSLSPAADETYSAASCPATCRSSAACSSTPCPATTCTTSATS